MRLAVLKETRPGEARVAATAETVRKLTALGLDVAVQAGAGQGASIADAEFQDAGATIVGDATTLLQGAGIVLAVQTPEPDVRALLPRGAMLLCISGALSQVDLVPALAQQGVDLVAMELLPRITRAQSMDVLSSQSNLAGYRAVIEGAAAFDRGFAMMMTAAGTVPPARVFVLGAGVAGLQAIATARRLGAIVSATDVRPAAKEEIRSLGATYVGVEDDESADAQTSGGYAKEMSAAFRSKQAELMVATVAKNDLVICTALVMGRKAPTLLTHAMVAGMKPGSVVVDLASDAGGNCEATTPGEQVTTSNGVKILGWRNWPARIPVAASALYARNLLTFITTFWDKSAGKPVLPPEDDIVRGVLLTREGAVIAEQFRAAALSPAAAAATTASAAPPAATVTAMAAGEADGLPPAKPAHGSPAMAIPETRADAPPTLGTSSTGFVPPDLAAVAPAAPGQAEPASPADRATAAALAFTPPGTPPVAESRPAAPDLAAGSFAPPPMPSEQGPGKTA